MINKIKNYYKKNILTSDHIQKYYIQLAKELFIQTVQEVWSNFHAIITILKWIRLLGHRVFNTGIQYFIISKGKKFIAHGKQRTRKQQKVKCETIWMIN